jgi:hypothetical protein
MKFIDYIRFCLTILLLWVIFHHAHWSVALALTLMAIRHEVCDWMDKVADDILLKGLTDFAKDVAKRL